MLKYQIDKLGYVLNGYIYTLSGFQVHHPFNNLLISREGNLKWNGTDSNGIKLPVGNYILLIEAFNAAVESGPKERITHPDGSYDTVFLNAYDAGTEANDELRGSGAPGEAGMPVPPPLDPLLGMNGTGVTDMESNDKVHIHRGSLGDSDMSAGISDINNSVQRWLNPVAKLTITVK